MSGEFRLCLSQFVHNYIVYYEWISDTDTGKVYSNMDRLKIMVVDDESRMRKLVSDFLIKSNYVVVEAADGAEAIDIFF